MCAASSTSFWDSRSFLHLLRITQLKTTVRRKARRERAKARRNWFLHKHGWVSLTKAALRKIRHILSTHHSRDALFLSKISQAMNMDEEDPNETYFPWKCPCGRINKKYAVECAICWGSWKKGTRHPTRPKQKETYGWQDWDNWDEDSNWASSRSSSRSSTRYRQDGGATAQHSHQKPILKGKKGKGGKGKGKKGVSPGMPPSHGGTESTSPFQQGDNFAPWTPMDTAQFMPTTALPSSPFSSVMPASTSSEKQEMVEHLRKAYPDPAKMPEDTKLCIEKTEQETGRMGIKNLHQATKYLGKVKKHLQEVTDQRRAHRSLWMAHLSNGIKMWEKQLDDFRRHQATLTEHAGKARTEITATNRIIQQLSNATAGGPTLPPSSVQVEAEEIPEDPADKEEEVLRKQLQGVLQSCAGSLGLELGQKATDIQEDDTADEDKRSKRPRALEPFAGGASRNP